MGFVVPLQLVTRTLIAFQGIPVIYIQNTALKIPVSVAVLLGTVTYLQKLVSIMIPVPLKTNTPTASPEMSAFTLNAFTNAQSVPYWVAGEVSVTQTRDAARILNHA